MQKWQKVFQPQNKLIKRNLDDYGKEQHEVPQFLAIFVNPKNKMGLEEHICHRFLDLPDDKTYAHATPGPLSKGYYFSELYTFTVTGCITLIQFFPSDHIFSTC